MLTSISRRNDDVAPDGQRFLMVQRADGAKGGVVVEQFTDVGRLVLAAEVLSASTTRNDRSKKRKAYQQEAVPETWIVDPAWRFVERWRPEDHEPEVLLEQLEWHPVAEHAALLIDFGAMFREAMD